MVATSVRMLFFYAQVDLFDLLYHAIHAFSRTSLLMYQSELKRILVN